MPAYTRIAAMAGSNKGIGLACVRQLGLQYPKSSYNNGPLLIYLTAWNQERGEAAPKSIHEDSQLKFAKALSKHSGLADIKFLPLDIDSKESIDEFAAQINKEHPEGIDILINKCWNSLGRACRDLVPQIRDGGHLVNVASLAGQLGPKYSGNIKSRFVNSNSIEDITKLMEEFAGAVEKNSYSDWPGAAYAVSKAGVIGMTRASAIEHAKSGSQTLINSCCPGYVNTDMTKGNGVKTPDEGAKTPVLLALGDIQGANGKAVSWAK